MKPLRCLARQHRPHLIILGLHARNSRSGHVETNCLYVSSLNEASDCLDIPPPPPPLEVGVKSSLFSFASFAFNCPICV